MTTHLISETESTPEDQKNLNQRLAYTFLSKAMQITYDKDGSCLSINGNIFANIHIGEAECKEVCKENRRKDRRKDCS